MGKRKRKETDEKVMDIVGHLSELRRRLLVTAVFFSASFLVGFVYVEEIYHFFVRDLEMTLITISPGEILWVYFSLAGLAALALTLPLLCYQIWAFVKPGLTEKERRVAISYIPAVFLLFIAGLIFGYFLYTKSLIPFLLSLDAGMFEVMFTVEKYFSFLFHVAIPTALLFEMPIAILFLTSLGIVTPNRLKSWRKPVYFILVIVSTIITPAPDFFLPLVLSIPLYLIYEVSIALACRVHRKRTARRSLAEYEFGKS